MMEGGLWNSTKLKLERYSKLASGSISGGRINILRYDTIRYDTIAEFNVESKAEYSALSSTLSQKKKLKQTTPVSL